MKYEIKIWNDPKNMPDFKPEKAANLLQSTANAINKSLGLGKGVSNPDILIDQNAGGEDAIQSVEISYITKNVDDNGIKNISIKKDVRVIKIDIKGDLYLPLDEGIAGDAKKALGFSQGAENKLRDTLLLSKWASVIPEKDKDDHFYRGIVINIITKAGDFRLITAKKVYVESYRENYQEGEFGTFTLSLLEKVDSNEDFKVDGLGYEKVPIVKSVGEKLEKAANVVATTGAVIAGIGAVGKTITETVEKFTGETTATRWLKYGFDTAGSAGKVADSASNILKKPKDIKNWTDEITKVNQNVQDRIQTGIDTKDDLPLAKMEALYLSKIQSDPERYKKYLHMSDADKRKELEKASEEMRAATKTTKDMEKSVAAEKEIKNLEKEYLPLITKDAAQSEKYNKATMEEKLAMLEAAKKSFDDMQSNYLPLIKKDDAKFAEYNNATTDKQLEMLEAAKKNFDDMEKKYLPEIKKDDAKFAEYNKASIDKKLEMLEEVKAESEKKTSDTTVTTSNTNTQSNATTNSNEKSPAEKSDAEKPDDEKSPKEKSDLNTLISSAALKKNGN